MDPALFLKLCSAYASLFPSGSPPLPIPSGSPPLLIPTARSTNTGLDWLSMAAGLQPVLRAISSDSVGPISLPTSNALAPISSPSSFVPKATPPPKSVMVKKRCRCQCTCGADDVPQDSPRAKKQKQKQVKKKDLDLKHKDWSPILQNHWSSRTEEDRRFILHLVLDLLMTGFDTPTHSFPWLPWLPTQDANNLFFVFWIPQVTKLMPKIVKARKRQDSLRSGFPIRQPRTVAAGFYQLEKEVQNLPDLDCYNYFEENSGEIRLTGRPTTVAHQTYTERIRRFMKNRPLNMAILHVKELQSLFDDSHLRPMAHSKTVMQQGEVEDNDKKTDDFWAYHEDAFQALFRSAIFLKMVPQAAKRKRIQQQWSKHQFHWGWETPL